MTGRGTRREVRLALRALRVSRHHLANALCGFSGDARERVQGILVLLHNRELDLLAVLAAKPDAKRREAA